MAKETQSSVTGLRSSDIEVLKKELPEAGNEWTTFSGNEASEKTLMPDVVGMFSGTPKTGGAIWAYRFVTHLQAALLRKDPSFSLDTHTPALNITASSDSGYSVKTPRGTIRTRHIRQARWHMTAQAAGDKIPDAGQWPALDENGSKPGGRAWGLWRDVYGSMIQMPKTGLFVGGGGVAGQGEEVPAWDDQTPVERIIASYLNGFR
ncbi:hypothetical protein BDW62DRAFT_203150 [Aspergillus aurantiobrunneus]